MAARLTPLDLWLPPPDSGGPVGALVTTRAIQERFFEQECLPRFLSSANGPIGHGTAPSGVTVVAHHRITHPPPVQGRAWICSDGASHVPSLHANAALLMWEKNIRIAISSASLTEASYLKYSQSFDWIDVATDDPAGLLTLGQSLDFFAYALSSLEDWRARSSLPIPRDILERARTRKVECAEISSSADAIPIFPGVGRGSLISRALDMWRSPGRPRELYIEAARTPSLDELIWTIDELSVCISTGERFSIGLAGTELQRLGEPRALRSLVRQRYGGKITVDLYRPKLPRGARLEGNTLIFSNDEWLLRVVGSCSGIGQETKSEVHALICRSVECSRNPRLEEQLLSALVEVSLAC